MINNRIEYWENSLLDLGKRNKLINFKETKRSALEITFPEFKKLFDSIVVREKELSFSQLILEIEIVDGKKIVEKIEIPGDLKTNREIEDQIITLKAIRNKARTIFQEQGVNVLYLCFGFLDWNESEEKNTPNNKSPLLLVPINLVQRSIIDPFEIFLGEDEIVLNPTLCQKLQSECNVELPEFNHDESDINKYLESINQKVKEYSWSIDYKAAIGIFLFHKINMFKDLRSKETQIIQHPILKGLCGEKTDIPRFPKSLENYDHDKNILPEDAFQVLQADSSQQDAVLYAKEGYSFVLQGPPGTGKSQTIANIISECLAEEKKILFVSDKMAALEVVHKRLEQVGLSDYCLTLHNPRVKKTEFLAQIKEVLHKKKIKTNGNIARDLHKITKQKDELIKYCESLHKKIQPLNKTIYEACCEYLSLSDAIDIDYRLTRSHKMTEDDLIKRISALEEYVNCIANLSVSIKENPWYGFKQNDTTHSEREDIKIHFKKLFNYNLKLIETVQYIYKTFNLNLEATYSVISDAVISLENLVLIPDKFPEHYLSTKDFRYLYRLIDSSSINIKNLTEAKKLLDAVFYPSIYKLNGKKLSLLLTENTDLLFEKLCSSNYSTKNDIIRNLQFIETELDVLKNYPKKLASIIKVLNEKYEIHVDEKKPNISALRNNLEDILNLPKVCEYWFNNEKHSYIKNIIDNCIRLSNDLVEYKKRIGAIFDNDIYSEDLDVITRRFRTDYASFTRVLKTQYYKDKKTIQQYLKSNAGQLKHTEICELLEVLKEIKKTKDWFESKSYEFEEIFGEYYEKEHTNWDSINNKFCQVVEVIKMDGPLTKFQMLLLLKNNAEQNEVQEFKNFLSEYQENNVKKRFEDLLSPVVLIEGNDVFSESGILETLLNKTKELLELYSLLDTKENVNRDYEFYCNNIELLKYYQKLNDEYLSSVKKLKDTFGFLFKEHETDWEKIRIVFQWIEKWKETPYNKKISFSILDRIVDEDNFKKEIESTIQKIRINLFEVNPYIAWLNEKFYEYSFSAKAKLETTNHKIENCLQQFYLINEFVDFAMHNKKCTDNGLGSYLTYVEKEKLQNNQVVKAYKKRFLSVWVDSSLDKFPHLLNFRKSKYERLLSSFDEKDKEHLSFTPLRIMEIIQKSLPDNYDITSPDSEIGILKRELLKKRRIMPLRILFSKIPNLLTAYKPCFMMSPLSVSLFLESDDYKFDVVIFDEASQVKTENAVGAIVRGKQVIVCGDQHQLPPTNFFNATVKDNEYDDDDLLDEYEIDDSGSYESVLEECQKILPEITLRWHYRSRDETLIAFSNKYIYENRLITFPSNVQKKNDFGVELVYCKNGIYDRGKSRTNMIEAQKVAELVFDHFDHYPDRTIGVVTFSNAQQNAVDNEITKLRIEHQEYEKCFDETRNEPFFIKNLETVQGDERDTIILCVGYGKYANDKPISMNFGPLNKDGGERRLNVAITRAKCNIKIVTSITPFDLDLKRTKSKSVRLLKEYLAFAENNYPEEISDELIKNEDCNSIEEYICNCLDQNDIGYKRNVGFSDYKIDIAIPYSQNPNHFILAIETEGDQYKSARTERERYLTRGSVLRSMGWNIEHVWTPTLFQNKAVEMEKLIKRIKSSDSEFTRLQNIIEPISIATEVFENATPNENVCDYNDNKYSEIEEVEKKPSFGLEYYKVTEFPDREMSMYNCIKCVLNQEAPIHIDILCQRIAPRFKRKKVTEVFKKQVKQELQLIDCDYQKKNGFIYKQDKLIKARVPSEDKPDTLRTIDHISKEEIMIAMEAVIRDSFSVSAEGLIETTARVFGYNRTGENIHKKLKSVKNTMLRNNFLKKQQDKITLTDDYLNDSD